MSDYVCDPSRECGERVEGDCYAECGMSSSGVPLSDFFIDPPAVLPFDVPAQGVLIRQLRPDGVYHVFDHVGANNYPNAADVLAEGANIGFSRKIPRTVDFSKLTSASRLILIHDRGFIVNHADYYDAIERERRGASWAESWGCDCRERHDKVRPSEMCISLLWHDLHEGELEDQPFPQLMWNGRPQVLRKMRATQYFGARTPADVVPVYCAAAIAALPIHRFAVIAGSDAESQKRAAQALKAARRSGIQVDEVAR